MKKQIKRAIKAHLIRSAFYLLLLLAVCAIPYALAQRAGSKRNRPKSPSRLSTSQVPIASSGPAIAGNPPAPNFPNAFLSDQLNDPGVANCYTFSPGSFSYRIAVTDIGNHCIDCSTVIPLPFPVTIYGRTYMSVAAGSNGHLTFGTPYDGSNIECWPSHQGTVVLAPFWVHQTTIPVEPFLLLGIRVGVDGIAPNRVFKSTDDIKKIPGLDATKIDAKKDRLAF